MLSKSASESQTGIETLKRKVWEKAIALGLAGAALLGVSACDNTSSMPNDSETSSTSATANPGESSTATPPASETLPAVPAMEPLGVEKLSTPESLMQAFENNVIQGLYNSGTESANLNDLNKYNNDLVAYAEAVTAPLNAEFANTYLVSNWKDIPALVDMMSRVHDIHLRTVVYYIQTGGIKESPQIGLDKAPYQTYAKFIDGSAANNATGTGANTKWDISYTFVESDNAAANRVGEELTNNKELYTGATTNARTTWVQENGNWVLTGIY